MTQSPDDEQDFTPPTAPAPVPEPEMPQSAESMLEQEALSELDSEPKLDPQPDSQQQPHQDLETSGPAANAPAAVPPNSMPLADELGVEDIYLPIMGKNGKVFLTAGRDAPIGEFKGDFLILHPPQMPLDASDRGENFTNVCDERGILLNELGQPKKIPSATYMGCPIYIIGEQRPGTLKNYVVVLTPEGTQHAIYDIDGMRLTYTEIYALRNKSADGELAIFDDEIVCDL